MTLLQGAVLLGSLVAIVAWPQILRALGLDPNGAVAWLATVVRWIVVFLTVLLSFALTFNVGPAARQRWVWITPGTLAGTVAFLVFSYLFRLYVRYYGSYDRRMARSGGSWCCCSGTGSWAWCCWARPRWTGRSRPRRRWASRVARGSTRASPPICKRWLQEPRYSRAPATPSAH